MIRIPTIAVALSATMLAACISAPRPLVASGPSIEGTWRSGDGISTSTFTGGRLVTRFVETNEVLAQGSYSLTGNQANMQWISIASGENRSATCVLAGRNTMNCQSAGGPSFVLNRA